MALPDVIEITPRDALATTVEVPGSKSLTNRALLIAGLADGESRLSGALESDDTKVMIEGLRACGCEVVPATPAWRVRGLGGQLVSPRHPIDTGNSGTTARFLTAAATLASGPVVIDGNARMRERPIADLVDALRGLGAEIEIQGSRGCPPVRVAGGGLAGGSAAIDASRSSQYVSAVLMVAPYARSAVRLHLADGIAISKPYIELTLATMHTFGAEVSWSADDELYVATRPYAARDFAVEPDASAAVYPLCAAAVAGGHVRVSGIPASSIQADLGVLPILERMGCRVTREDGAVEVHGPRDGLRGVDVDMNDLPDASLAIAVVAAFASSPTRIRNVASLRIKETDRLAALENELRKLGAEAHASSDAIEIIPGSLRPAEIETYDDHRIAMSFAVAGLAQPGIRIRDPGCVSKTWPDFFRMLDKL